VDSAKLVDGVVVVRLQLEVTCVKSEVIETLATSADLNPDQITFILDWPDLGGRLFKIKLQFTRTLILPAIDIHFFSGSLNIVFGCLSRNNKLAQE
jgi:hypothetical protein